MRKIILAIMLVSAAACGGKKSDGGKQTDNGKQSDNGKQTDGDKAKADDPAKAPAAPQRPNDQALAFGLGQKMGYVDAFQIMKKPDKAQADLDDAKELAAALGIDPPHLPSGDEDEAIQIAHALKVAKGEPVFQAFVLGNRLRVSWFGAKIGASIGGQLADVEKAATALAIPESEWRAGFEKAKASSDADALDALSDRLQQYLVAH